MFTFLRVDKKTEDFELNGIKSYLHFSYSSFLQGCNFNIFM